jgi:hypothetical protein
MRLVWIAILAAAALPAATIRGVVLDNQTGRPLARATVVAQPISGTAGVTRSVKSDVNGALEFSGLAGGAWLVVASRRGFAPSQQGKGPVMVGENAEATLTIRMRHFGAITGTALDENEVGLQDLDVLAYRNTRPPVFAARAKTDDRGVYRIDGLVPGSYLIRTAWQDFDGSGYLPTFSREGARIEQARPVVVEFDREIPLADIHPMTGSMVVLTGHIFPQVAATVTLTSDTGSLSTAPDRNGRFEFPPVPPGPYELRAIAGAQAAWQRVDLYREARDPRVTLAPFPDLRLTLEDTVGRPVDPNSVQVLVRRRDPIGAGKVETLREGGRVLAPGRYEFGLAASVNWYVVSIPGGQPRPGGWNELVVNAEPPVEVKFVLSPRPSALRGVVRDANEPVAGVPVFLDDLRAVRSDTQGRFEFYGLRPGAHRLLASFDAESADSPAARDVQLEEGQEQSIDLPLHIAK